ncbi:MAG TPA: 16S rRNA (cytidine(1402)-2'-O)-methyltransferase [Firmicutes bacterium]|nr:16S rRNA (cytidine(1402)-2'-O)-methyltransferase [Bacillota bacterium]
MEKMKVTEGFDRGTLFLCATPIGNLRDITLRVLDCLKCADLVAAENPRHTQKLLNHFGIKASLTPYREANRERKSREIISRLQEGARVVLLSDAGMPGLSDPGLYLVRRLVEEELPYTVLPGASAVLTALINAAYPGTKFVFWGFLSHKKNRRRAELEGISKEEKTVVLYESPHRLLDTLGQMAKIMGERELTVCRELTKRFEEVIRGKPGYLLGHFTKGMLRGEVTLVISPLERSKEADRQENPLPGEPVAVKAAARKKIMQYLKNGCTPSAAAKKAAAMLPITRRKAYQLVLELKRQNDTE